MITSHIFHFDLLILISYGNQYFIQTDWSHQILSTKVWRVMYEIEWIWQAKTDNTLSSKSTEIMRMNESLEVDVHRAGIRQWLVFTRISPQTDCGFCELKNENGCMKMTKLLYFWYYWSIFSNIHWESLSYFPSPNKKFKRTNNKSRTQNATESIWWLTVTMIHSLGSPILTKRGQWHDTNIAQQKITTTGE